MIDLQGGNRDMLVIELDQIKSIEDELLVISQKIIHIEKYIKDIRKSINQYMEMIDLNIRFMEYDNDILKIISEIQQMSNGLNEIVLVCDSYEKRIADYLEEGQAVNHTNDLVYSVIPDRLIDLVGL